MADITDQKFQRLLDQTIPQMEKRGWSKEKTKEILEEIYLENEATRSPTNTEEICSRLDTICRQLEGIERSVHPVSSFFNGLAIIFWICVAIIATVLCIAVLNSRR